MAIMIGFSVIEVEMLPIKSQLHQSTYSFIHKSFLYLCQGTIHFYKTNSKIVQWAFICIFRLACGALFENLFWPQFE